jgi:hypothetical protein
MIIWNHNQNPPTQFVTPCIIGDIGISNTTNKENYPPGLYQQGIDDICPEGQGSLLGC